MQIQSDRFTKTSYAETFLLNLKSRNWMKLSGFATFLNRMGATRAKYGGVLVKKTEQDGQLGIHVVAWLIRRIAGSVLRRDWVFMDQRRFARKSLTAVLSSSSGPLERFSVEIRPNASSNLPATASVVWRTAVSDRSAAFCASRAASAVRSAGTRPR